MDANLTVLLASPTLEVSTVVAREHLVAEGLIKRQNCCNRQFFSKRLENEVFQSHIRFVYTGRAKVRAGGRPGTACVTVEGTES